MHLAGVCHPPGDRQAVVAYYAKYFDAASAFELKKKPVPYDRTLLIADPVKWSLQMEPKRFGEQVRLGADKRGAYAYTVWRTYVHLLYVCIASICIRGFRYLRTQ